MADPQHIAHLLAGAPAWNAWREIADERPDLTDAALPLSARQLGPVHGGPIDLRDADLRGTQLVSATLIEARLARADLSSTDLSDVRLDKADLSAADLSRSALDGASLAGARLDGTRLFGADLSGARHVSQAQVNAALGDETTRLPAGLTMPTGWREDDSAGKRDDPAAAAASTLNEITADTPERAKTGNAARQPGPAGSATGLDDAVMSTPRVRVTSAAVRDATQPLPQASAAAGEPPRGAPPSEPGFAYRPEAGAASDAASLQGRLAAQSAVANPAPYSLPTQHGPLDYFSKAAIAARANAGTLQPIDAGSAAVSPRGATPAWQPNGHDARADAALRHPIDGTRRVRNTAYPPYDETAPRTANRSHAARRDTPRAAMPTHRTAAPAPRRFAGFAALLTALVLAAGAMVWLKTPRDAGTTSATLRSERPQARLRPSWVAWPQASATLPLRRNPGIGWVCAPRPLAAAPSRATAILAAWAPLPRHRPSSVIDAAAPPPEYAPEPDRAAAPPAPLATPAQRPRLSSPARRLPSPADTARRYPYQQDAEDDASREFQEMLRERFRARGLRSQDAPY